MVLTLVTWAGGVLADSPVESSRVAYQLKGGVTPPFFCSGLFFSPLGHGVTGPMHGIV
jgi:hypothetical protein